MIKRIAFFGDSFVSNSEGWIGDFCNKYDYIPIHFGKPGADQFYSFEKWEKFNRMYKGEKVDVCVYAHTGADRLYHPHPDVPLVLGVVKNIVEKKMPPFPIEDSLKVAKAAMDYFIHLGHFRGLSLTKSKLIPYAIDGIMKEKNVSCKKIIHLWSFAQYMKNLSRFNWASESEWNLINTVSGTNVLLSLSNASSSDPKFNGNVIDQRPNHFSDTMNPFMVDLLKLAIDNTDFETDKKAVIDFRPYVHRDSTYEEYFQALEKIKKEHNG